MHAFPSTLIIGNDYQKLLESLGHSSQNPDLFIIDNDYSIESVRKINWFLSQLPYNHQNKVVLIKNIENLETVAQNALLKNIAEPGNNNYFIITTQNQSKIIPTIISRCQIINSVYQEPVLNQAILKEPTDIKSALEISSSVEKNNIKQTLLDELNNQQQNLVKNPSPKITHQIKTLLKALDYIDSNLDPRLALDFYLLTNI